MNIMSVPIPQSQRLISPTPFSSVGSYNKWAPKVSFNSAMGALDPSFIQELDHRPNFNMVEAEGIPVIDLLSAASMAAGSNDELASRIGDACRTWGFFQVINHGVPVDLRRRVEVLAKEFFDRPLEEKVKVKRDEVHPMGYHDSEHTKNIRDWKEVFDFFLQDPTLVPASCEFEDKELRELTNQWPADFPEFRTVLEEYARAVEKLAFRLLEFISLSLGLPADRFSSCFKEQTSFLRLNHYPPCPQPELALGVGRHKDGGALTVLFQDSVGGLQIQRRSDDEWISVRPVPDSYVINLGNAMQVWTNDKYWSADHRVLVNTDRERFSIPFFFFPGHQVDVKPLDALASEQNPPLYKEFNWGKFFVSRNRSDFKKLDVENIQIDHFKAPNN